MPGSPARAIHRRRAAEQPKEQHRREEEEERPEQANDRHRHVERDERGEDEWQTGPEPEIRILGPTRDLIVASGEVVTVDEIVGQT
jgi:hypothetical protein